MTEKRLYGQPLSRRELQILRAAADGETASAAATRLRIGQETVKTIRTHILQKFGAVNIAHAVAIGFRKGWIT